jgi:hypothetical protein
MLGRGPKGNQIHPIEVTLDADRRVSMHAAIANLRLAAVMSGPSLGVDWSRD